MNSRKDWKLLFQFVIIISFAFMVFLALLTEEQQNWVNFFGILGTVTTLVGFGIALVQIQSVKETSEQTRIAVNESIQKINQFTSIADLSRSVRLVVEV